MHQMTSDPRRTCPDKGRNYAATVWLLGRLSVFESGCNFDGSDIFGHQARVSLRQWRQFLSSATSATLRKPQLGKKFSAPKCDQANYIPRGT